MCVTVSATFLSLLAFVALLFTIIGSTHNAPFVRDISLFRFDLNVGAAPSSNSTANSTSSVPDYTIIGMWSYCEGTSKGGISFCSDPGVGWQFADGGALALAINTKGSEINTSLDKTLIAFYVGACVATFLAIISGVFSHGKRFMNFLASVLAFIAFVLSIAAFVTDIMFYRAIYNSVTTNNDRINSSLTDGTWITLAAILLLALGSFGFLFSCCTACCRKRKDPQNLAAQNVHDEPVTPVNEKDDTAATGSKWAFWKKKNADDIEAS